MSYLPPCVFSCGIVTILFLENHWLAAAVKCAFTSSGNDEFRATFGAQIPFSYFVCHSHHPLSFLQASEPRLFRVSLFPFLLSMIHQKNTSTIIINWTRSWCQTLYSPIICSRISLDRERLSKSTRIICCHVPRVNL